MSCTVLIGTEKLRICTPAAPSHTLLHFANNNNNSNNNNKLCNTITPPILNGIRQFKMLNILAAHGRSWCGINLVAHGRLCSAKMSLPINSNNLPLMHVENQ